MTQGENGAGLLRERGESGERVTNFELFFDLVYVFAVTQLAHLLLGHPNALGAVQTLVLLLAVWWAWIYTAWITNWFNPDRSSVRLILIGVMLLSLIMSAAIPEAFAARGLYFAGAYVVIQLGRTIFAIARLDSHPQLRRNFQRILTWSVTSGLLWLLGAFATDIAREVLWLAAVLVDYAAPAFGFFTPGWGRSHTTDWTITGSHLAERCQLFLIIALGETILDTGVTFGELPWSAMRVTALAVAFVSIVALWWIYFYRSAQGGQQVISSAVDPGRLGRSAYTYFHLPMVAGIIVTAVADELTIAHPGSPARAATAMVIAGGPTLFLAGHALYKWALSGRIYISRLVAIGVLGALALLGNVMPALLLAILTGLVLVAVAGRDTWSAGSATGTMHKGESEPTPSVERS